MLACEYDGEAVCDADPDGDPVAAVLGVNELVIVLLTDAERVAKSLGVCVTDSVAICESDEVAVMDELEVRDPRIVGIGDWLGVLV